ncbi:MULTISPECIES: hypothetical protein [unclassified Anabaena]|uniref:hypothetical protein n=1 Tax=unclassified Anabaena TaxID=2619674 RepID=UPI0039C6EA3F
MFLRRWLKPLNFLGWEFWLPLPVLGIVFWSSGNLVVEKVLSRPYNTVNKLQTDTRPEFHLSIHLLMIRAEIDRHRGISEVIVKTTDSNTRNFQVPVTDISLLETAIAQELGMSIDHVRKIVRYQINE